jgi:hypothetical protein
MEVLRTCLACRNKAERSYLLRFVRAQDGEVCFDDKAVLPSRGAWLCPQKNCVKKALEKKLLFRGEKILPIDKEKLLKIIDERLTTKTLSRFGLLRRMGLVEVGRDAVVRLAKKEQLAAIFLAQDLAERSVDELNTKLSGQSLLVLKGPFSMDEFSNCLGRAKTGVVGLLQSRITNEALNQVKKIAAFKKLG